MTNANENFKHLQLEVAHSGDVIPDRIPTVSVKKAIIQSTMDDDTKRASATPVSGQNSLLTYLHLASNVQRTTYALTDADGTFDVYLLGTTATGQGVSVTQQGNWKEPIRAVKGTFSIYNAGAGSYGAGSFVMAFELVRV